MVTYCCWDSDILFVLAEVFIEVGLRHTAFLLVDDLIFIGELAGALGSECGNVGI